MKISGFTFVKNAVKYSYPVVESISSILPIVDEMVICLGDSEDETNALISSIGSDKIKIVHSVWDKDLREGGMVLAVETDKAMHAVASDSDWLFYIQADEVVHEQDLPVIRAAMEKYLGDKRVEGLLFNYHHFIGSSKFIGDGPKWYSKEIRVIRNDTRIRSYRDAQGFRWDDDRKLNVKLIDAWIYHYGWVRPPVAMQRKYADFGKLWNTGDFYDAWAEDQKKADAGYDYSQVDSISPFTGTHPAVMKARISREDWTFDADLGKKNFKNFRHKVLYKVWKLTGWRPFEYSNYKRI